MVARQSEDGGIGGEGSPLTRGVALGRIDKAHVTHLQHIFDLGHAADAAMHVPGDLADEVHMGANQLFGRGPFLFGIAFGEHHSRPFLESSGKRVIRQPLPVQATSQRPSCGDRWDRGGKGRKGVKPVAAVDIGQRRAVQVARGGGHRRVEIGMRVKPQQEQRAAIAVGIGGSARNKDDGVQDNGQHRTADKQCSQCRTLCA